MTWMKTATAPVEVFSFKKLVLYGDQTGVHEFESKFKSKFGWLGVLIFLSIYSFLVITIWFFEHCYSKFVLGFKNILTGEFDPSHRGQFNPRLEDQANRLGFSLVSISMDWSKFQHYCSQNGLKVRNFDYYPGLCVLVKTNNLILSKRFDCFWIDESILFRNINDAIMFKMRIE